MRQALFEQRKAAEIQSHQERIQILRKADACIRAATRPESFRVCEETERNERMAFMERDQKKREQMKGQMRERLAQGRDGKNGM